MKTSFLRILIIICAVVWSLGAQAQRSPSQVEDSRCEYKYNEYFKDSNLEIVDSLVTWQITKVSETRKSYIITYEYKNLTNDTLGVYLPKQDDCCLQFFRVYIKSDIWDIDYRPCNWVADVESAEFAGKTIYKLAPNESVKKQFALYKKHLHKKLTKNGKVSFQLELLLKYCGTKYSTYKRVFAPDEIKTNVYNWHKK